MAKIAFYNFLILLFFSSALSAQVYPFRTYSIQNGLSQSSVEDIVQDNDGYLWVTTEFGLNRFNGTKFKQFYAFDGLPSNRLNSIFKDKQGNLIIGSAEGLVTKRATSIEFDPFPLEGFKPGYAINDIFHDHRGSYWIATEGGGLWKITGNQTQHFSTLNGLGSDSVRVIRQDRDGRYWVGTRNGLTIIGVGDTVTYRVRHGLADNKVRDIVIAPTGDIWLATRGGLNRYRNGRFSTFTVKEGLVNNRLTSLQLDQSGVLWIGSEDGLSTLQNDSFKNYTAEQGLEFTLINKVFEDREGNIWLGTFGGGLIRFQGRYIENLTVDQTLPHNVVTSIASDQFGHVWVGTFGRGIVRYEDKPKYLNAENGLNDNRVQVIYKDSKDRMWVATRAGLMVFQNNRPIKIPQLEYISSRRVTHITESSNGDMWISNEEDGLYQITNSQINLYTEKEGLASNNVRKVIQRKDGSIWVATLAGISVFDEGRQFTSITTENGLLNNGVLSLYEDEQQYLWVSTIGGISRFDGRSFDNVEFLLDGRPSICYYIVQYGEWYLIGTNQGLLRFNQFNPEGNHLSDILVGMKRFTTTNGLVSNELNPNAFHIDQQYRFWAGTVGGVSVYNALKDFRAKSAPLTYIDRVIVFDAEFEQPRNQISLNYNENYVTFEFSAISFEAPELVEYEYRLRGIDMGWQRTHLPMVRYTALPHGEYRFEVKARGNSNVWSDNVTRLVVKINPPFWLSYWFIGINVIVFLAVLYSLYRNFAAKRMIDLERMRIRIASDLHDDVGASLSEIALHADYVQAVSTNTEVKDALQQIGTMSRRIVTTMDDIVWSIDARNDTAGDLTDRMQDYALNILSAADINVKFEFDGVPDQQAISVDLRQNLYLIFKEAVNNAAKHSKATQLLISFKVQGNVYSMRIEDNGNGMSEQARKSGHGLKNMKMRAKRIEADIQLASNELGKGFSVIVTGKFS